MNTIADHLKTMKTPLLFVLLLIVTVSSHGQAVGNISASSPAAPTAYTVVSRDANSAIWQRQTYDQGPNGTIVTNIHRYTEIASGLNHLVNGQYLPSSETIVISPDGRSAMATNGQHQMYWPGNIYSGVIKFVTPDSQVVESQPIGLAYSDGTNSVLLAVVTNSTGAILPSGNKVIYTNAFAGLDADIVYTYTKAGIEQDVVIQQQPPDPASFNLSSASTRLQMLTEFVSAPQPNVTVSTIPTAAGRLEDDNLNFGTMAMGHGKAFLLGTNSPSTGVEKRWVMLNGRHFLVEEVPIVSVAKAIDSLPPYVAKTGTGTRPVVSKNLMLPPPRLVHATPKTQFLAQAEPPSRGLVMDYVTFTGGVSNYVFQGDTTYYLSSSVYAYSGSFTFEGGTVLKYARGASLNFIGGGWSSPQINWLGSAYRPVVLTASDDNSAGQTISGSSGSPTGYYANPALTFEAFNFSVDSLRIAYAQVGLDFDGAGGKVADAQLVDCQQGVWSEYTSAIWIENALFANVQTNFSDLAETSLQVENCTIANSAALETGQTINNNYASLSLTNCILANVAYNFYSQDTLSGDHNGFYNSSTFGNSPISTTSKPFQTAGAGSYYLTNGCTFFDAGTTNIDPALLADLQTKATYPPIIYSNTTFASAQTFSPQAQRDTGIPDLGYHYDPLDYAFGGVDTSYNLTFSAGTATAFFQLPGSGGPGYSISLHGQITAAFNGTATAPCVVARYNAVQEGANGNWADSGWLGGIKSYEGNSYTVSIAPQIVAAFTRFDGLSAEPPYFRDYYTPLVARVIHSEFYNDSIGAYNNAYYFTNCLFYRFANQQIQGYSASDAYTLQNCTSYGGELIFTPNYNPIPLYVHDCTFDGTTLNISYDATWSGFGNYDYNAFTNGMTRFPIGGSHDQVVTGSFNWQPSWFGGFYLPAGSPLLSAGDVTAAQVGLYHFTTQTGQSYEGQKSPGTHVDIGYHYVAVDQYGFPLDYNGDGIPDYIEDANGNGLVDSGEIAWNIYDVGLNVIITRPRNGSILP